MAVVFDFDGVIVDTREDNILAINLLAKKYAFDSMDDASYSSMLSCNFYEYWQMLLGSRAQEFFSDLHHMQRPIAKILPGLVPILHEHKPAIVSSNYSMLIQQCLRSHHIELPVYGADYDKSKVRKLQQLKKMPDIFVTDTVGDIIEGKQAGYVVIAVSWGFNTLDMLQKAQPYYIVHSPQELQDVLEALTQEVIVVTH